MLTDPAFTDTTFVVIDFETLTPAGRPPVPIEVAAIAGKFSQDGTWAESGRFESLMRPPDDVPFTKFDQAESGLTIHAVAGQPRADEVMAALSARLSKPPYRLVAHSAHTEATVIAGQRQHCPALASTSLLCTVKLSRLAFPELGSHSLDAVLRFLGIPIPAYRHRAMADAELTVEVFKRALAAGQRRHQWKTLQNLDAVAGVAPRRATHGAEAFMQDSLF